MRGAELLDAAERHAEMLGLEHDADAARSELVLQPVRDLDGHALLDLQVAGEQLDDPAELAQADDPVGRQVADVRDPVERQQVVHAERVERDRPRDDQRVVAVLVGEARRREGLRREQLRVGVGDAPRRVAQVLGLDVGAERQEEVARGAAGGGVVDPARRSGVGRERVQCGHADLCVGIRRGLT